MKTPLFSIIVVSHNDKKKINNFIDTIKKQTYKNTETIIVDNDSTDKNIIKYLNSIKEKKIKVIRLKTNNISIAINKGFEESKGDFVVMFDDDCMLPKEWVKKAVDTFNQEPPTTGLIRTTYYERDQTYIINKKKYVSAFGAGGTVFKREVLNKLDRLYLPEFNWFLLDNELAVRIINKGYKIVCVPEPKYFHDSISLEKKPFNDKRHYYRYRNGLWLIWMHYPLHLILIETPIKIITTFFISIKNKKPMLFFRIIKDAIKGINFCIKNREVAKKLPLYSTYEILTKSKRLTWREKTIKKNNVFIE